jgi:hypothetical protein
MGRRRDSTPGGKRGDERPALAIPLHLATVANREAVTRTGEPRDPAPSATLYSSPSTGVLLRAQVALGEFTQTHNRKGTFRKSAPRPWTPAPPSIPDSSRFPLHAPRLRWIAAFSLPCALGDRGTATDASSLPPARSPADGHLRAHVKPPGRRRSRPPAAAWRTRGRRDRGADCELRMSPHKRRQPYASDQNP